VRRAQVTSDQPISVELIQAEDIDLKTPGEKQSGT
jgi:hypothetical protein